MRINFAVIITLGILISSCSTSIGTNYVQFQEAERDNEITKETFTSIPLLIPDVKKTETPTITPTIYSTNTNTPIRGEIAIEVLKTYVSTLDNIDKIRLIYRPDHQWIYIPEDLPAHKEYIREITNLNEINTIIHGFKLAKQYSAFWSMCGFYFRIDFMMEGDELDEAKYIRTLFLGRDDDRSFTMKDVHAVGTMDNDFLYSNYIVPMRGF